MNMQVQDVPLEIIIPYRNNPRNNTKTIDKLMQSINSYGFRVPIVLNSLYVIITGHTRYEAVKRLGWKTIPAIVVDDMTPEQEQAFRIVDNKVQDFSRWDNKKLQEEVDSLYSTFGIELSTYELQNPRILITSDEYAPSEELIEHATRTQEQYIGTSWRLGRHILIHGDSTEESNIEWIVPEIDMILIDPPYGVEYDEGIINDDLDTYGIEQLLDKSFKIWGKRLVTGGSVYVWFTADIRPIYGACIKNDIKIKQSLTWVKDMFTLTRNHYKQKTEQIFYGHKSDHIAYGWKNDGASQWYGGFDKSTVFEAPKPKSNKLHPTMKPLSILGELIQNSSPVNGVVADYFAGSGSTIIACEQLGRSCVAKELNPKFIPIIIDRWEQLTGGKAERIV